MHHLHTWMVPSEMKAQSVWTPGDSVKKWGGKEVGHQLSNSDEKSGGLASFSNYCLDLIFNFDFDEEFISS